MENTNGTAQNGKTANSETIKQAHTNRVMPVLQKGVRTSTDLAEYIFAVAFNVHTEQMRLDEARLHVGIYRGAVSLMGLQLRAGIMSQNGRKKDPLKLMPARAMRKKRSK